jgi:GT2 family glycosyltransferase
MDKVGIVVIGRNEGERLRACLQSISSCRAIAVYVDSGSSDGSPELARSLGFEVVELNPNRRFSAARGRNEGFERLVELHPNLDYVQFIDGDCELADSWFESAIEELDANKNVAVVCGRILERHPEESVYNRLRRLEWTIPVGEIDACSGNLMIRSDAFRAVGGFRADIIAAEDDDLCIRLSQLKWRLRSVDADMAYHDAAVMDLASWARRAVRSGHAFAQSAALHGNARDNFFVRNCIRAWLWGAILPVVALTLAWPTSGLSLALLIAYPIQIFRIYRANLSKGWGHADSFLFAAFMMLEKFPTLAGVLEFYRRRWRGQPLTIIEYKGASKTA